MLQSVTFHNFLEFLAYALLITSYHIADSESAKHAFKSDTVSAENYVFITN